MKSQLAQRGPIASSSSLRASRPDKAAWITLPERCDLEVPEFPLLRPTGREEMLWNNIWTWPQAVMWHEMKVYTQVALYVRMLRRTENAGVKFVKGMTDAVNKMADDLGISVNGLARHYWEMPNTADAQGHGAMVKPDDTGRETARSRFEIIDGGSTPTGT